MQSSKYKHGGGSLEKRIESLYLNRISPQILQWKTAQFVTIQSMPLQGIVLSLVPTLTTFNA